MRRRMYPVLVATVWLLSHQALAQGSDSRAQQDMPRAGEGAPSADSPALSPPSQIAGTARGDSLADDNKELTREHADLTVRIQGMHHDARDGALVAPALVMTGAVMFTVGGAFLNGFSRSEDFGDGSSPLIALPIVGGLATVGSLIWLVQRAERRGNARLLLPDLEQKRQDLERRLQQLGTKQGARVSVWIAPVLSHAAQGVSFALRF